MKKNILIALVFLFVLSVGYAAFAVPRDAHAMEERADAVMVSGLYVGSKGEHSECPLVESTAVDDSVEDYDPFSGQARVNATFIDEEMAREAAEKGCLLVRDVN